MATNFEQNWRNDLHSAPWHFKTDWNIAIWISCFLALMITIHCVQITSRYDVSILSCSSACFHFQYLESMHQVPVTSTMFSVGLKAALQDFISAELVNVVDCMFFAFYFSEFYSCVCVLSLYLKYIKCRCVLLNDFCMFLPKN